MLKLLRFLALLAAPAIPGLAQSTSGQITGQVQDPAGASVPEAQIEVTNVENGFVRSTRTSAAGGFTLAALPPGSYRLSVTKQGFKPIVRTGVSIRVDQVARFDFILEVGAAAESITVEAAAPLLDQATSALGQVIDNTKISNIPLNGRSSFRLVQLTPGVLSAPSANGQFGDIPVNTMDDSIFSINGGRNKSNEVLIDGVPSTTGFVNGITTIPSIDSTAEFKVQSSNLSAEWGRFSGGVVNVSTKSGTNQLHGSLFEFLRNSAMDANEFFNNRAGGKRPPFRMNQYGFAAGGPVRLGKLFDGRNKTFFFADLQQTRYRRGDTFLATLPTALQRTGDFSQTLTGTGALIAVFDPASTVTQAGRSVRTPFGGNRIPTNRLDPIARNLVTYYPNGNTAGDPNSQTNNYFSNAQRTIDQANYSFRGDQNIGANHRLFGRFAAMRSTLGQPDVFGNIASSGVGANGKLLLNNLSGALDSTSTLNPNTILTVRYGVARFYWGRPTRSFGFDQSKLGYPTSLTSQYQVPVFPIVNVDGFAGLGGGSVLFTGQDTHSLLASVTRVAGSHTLKLGFDGRLRRMNRTSVTAGGGRFAFNRGFTQGPDPNVASLTAGHGLASLLLGTAASGDANLGVGIALQNFYFAAYLQDDFRVNRRLTLNLGLRYESETAPTERYNQLNFFNFGLPSPVRNPQFPNLTGGYEYASANSRSTFVRDANNVAPRFGFAYTLNKRTVLRGGAGLFYAPLEISDSDTGYSPSDGYSAGTPYVASIDGGLNAFRSVSMPFPEGLVKPTANRLGARTFLGQGTTSWMRSPRTPLTVQWNFDLQHELPGAVVVDVAYTASRGMYLTQNREFNALDPQYLALGTGLQAQVDNPFFGQITTGALAQPRVARRQLLLPYPQFTSVLVINDTSGNSTYHALNLKVEKRYRAGLSILGSYTWAKLLADVRNGLSTLDNNQNAGLRPGIQNWYDLRSERAVSELDVQHNLTLSYVLELPFGKGKRFAAQASGWAGKVVDGWQFSGITVLRGGFPLNFSAPIAGGGNRPNSTGVSAHINDHGSRGGAVARWFDTSQFLVPPPFTNGNVGRALSSVRGPALLNQDLALAKNTRVSERINLQLRFESFNLLNRPHLWMPVTAANNIQFGQITSTTGLPRVNQVALKVIF